ncbi:MAG: cyclase [Chlorobiaceae bacterium]|nr:cyclase [Chlorobiaceae bacterium]NTW10792.1 cyclase [Chlorobiaceae bacterium]
MKSYPRSLYRILLALVPAVFFSIAAPRPAVSETLALSSATGEQKVKLLGGEVIVSLTELQEGVTGVTGHIYIAAPPAKVWEAITDYDNHKNFVPNVLESGVLADNGSEKIMFEKGKSGIFLFQKKVYTKMKVWGESAKHLYFQQIDGDFQVYRGEWILDESQQGKGTFLTYKAEVKPDFFAPQFAVRNVQERDCPRMMMAMKKQAEALLHKEQNAAQPVTRSPKNIAGSNQS